MNSKDLNNDLRLLNALLDLMDLDILEATIR